MSKLTVSELHEQLICAVDLIRGAQEIPTVTNIIAAVLAIKFTSDNSGNLGIREYPRWADINGSDPRDSFNRELRVLQTNSDSPLLASLFTEIRFQEFLSPKQAGQLFDHFSKFGLHQENLAFRNVVGIAFDRFLEWATANRKGADFNTPSALIDLMTRLADPKPGQSILDPFAGKASILVNSGRYVEESQKEGAALEIRGQEINKSAFDLARLNLFLNQLDNSSMSLVNSIATPPFNETDHLMQFDRVLTNPPFSLRIDREEISECFEMGDLITGPGRSIGDLVCVQLVLSFLKPSGMGAIVVPQGILFRGGPEKRLRRNIVSRGQIEAVIGFGPNLFYGTSIPTCLLLLRGADEQVASHRNEVLFVDASGGFRDARGKEQLSSDQVERIVRAYQDRRDIHGFAKVVPTDQIASNDFNLNIAQYVQSAEDMNAPLDIKAAIVGGIPRSAVEGARENFEAFGIDPTELFDPMDDLYLAFPSDPDQDSISRIWDLSSSAPTSATDLFDRWWQKSKPQIDHLITSGVLLEARRRIMDLFVENFNQILMLDPFEISGLFAESWSLFADEFRVLSQSRQVRSSTFGNHDLQALSASEALDRFGQDLRLRIAGQIDFKRYELVATYRRWSGLYGTPLEELKARSRKSYSELLSTLEEYGILED